MYSQGNIPYDYNTIKMMSKDKGLFCDYERREKIINTQLQSFEMNKKAYEEKIKLAEEEYHLMTKSIKMNDEMLKKLKSQQINYYSEL